MQHVVDQMYILLCNDSRERLDFLDNCHDKLHTKWFASLVSIWLDTAVSCFLVFDVNHVGCIGADCACSNGSH